MTLAYRVDGPAGAPPLVLLNSIGSSTEMWTPCLAPLTERLRIIRVDTRGHGASAPVPLDRPGTLADLGADVLGVLDELGLGRVPIAGLSLGGMVAMWLAIHRPERVSRLALLCTSARLEPELWAERMRVARTDGMAALADPILARWVTPGFAARDAEALSGLRAMITAVDAESYAQCAEAIVAMDLRPDLARIAAPTLVIGAADDPATPLPHQELLADAIPGARLEVVPDAAHIVTVEQSARVAALLLSHVGGDGWAVRRAVLGDDYVDAAVAATTSLTAGFQEFLTRYAWGGVWTDDTLPRRERSIATLAALVTLGAENELAAHVHGAVRNGLAPEEILALLQHLAIYAGVPRANRAVTIARTVLEGM